MGSLFYFVSLFVCTSYKAHTVFNTIRTGLIRTGHWH